MKRSSLIAIAIVVVFILVVGIYSLFSSGGPTEHVGEPPPPGGGTEAPAEPETP